MYAQSPVTPTIGPSTELLRYTASPSGPGLLAHCATDSLVQVMLEPTDHPAVWLQRTADAIATQSERLHDHPASARRVGVRCALATADWATGDWRLTTVAEAGFEVRAARAQSVGTGSQPQLGGQIVGQTVHQLAGDGVAPPVDVTGLGGVPAGVPPRDGVVTRRDVIGDAQWKESPIRHRRQVIGVDEFIRLTSTLNAPRDPGRLIIQLDRIDGQTWEEELLREFLVVVGPHFSQAYTSLVAVPQARRQMLLQRVSPVQRQILPLLIEGKTEREIALSMHRSPHTIHDHVKTIYAELGISSRYELLDLWSGRHAVDAHAAHSAQHASEHQHARAGG